MDGFYPEGTERSERLLKKLIRLESIALFIWVLEIRDMVKLFRNAQGSFSFGDCFLLLSLSMDCLYQSITVVFREVSILGFTL